MQTERKMRKFYTIARNIVVAAILMVVGIYLILYVALSLPVIQNFVKETACEELSGQTGVELEIGRLSISPFNQVVLENVVLPDPEGGNLAVVEKVGCGISLWRLFTKGQLVFTYAEIIGLDARIVQRSKDGPLNIQFLIDAFKSKEENKPPTRFDFSIQSVVLRKCSASFDREWVKETTEYGLFDANHIYITNLRGDISLPRLSNADFLIDLRRISFVEQSGFEVESLKGLFDISETEISVKDLYADFGGTEIHPENITLKIDGLSNIKGAFESDELHLVLNQNEVYPADFKAFLPMLGSIEDKFTLDVDVIGNSNDINVNRFSLVSDSESFDLYFRGKADSLKSVDDVYIDLSQIHLSVDQSVLAEVTDKIEKLSASLRKMIVSLGNIRLTGVAEGDLNNLSFDGSVLTTTGNISLNVDYNKLPIEKHHIVGSVETQDFNLGKLLDNQDFGIFTMSGQGDLTLDGGDVNGRAEVDVAAITFKGYTYSDIFADISKYANSVEGVVNLDDPNIKCDAEGIISMAGEKSHSDFAINISKFNPSATGLWTKYPEHTFSVNMEADFDGNRFDNSDGFIELSNLKFVDNLGMGVIVENVRIDACNSSSPQRIELHSDLADGYIEGVFDFTKLPSSFKQMTSKVLPSLMSGVVQDESKTNLEKKQDIEEQNFICNFNIKEHNMLPEFFQLPIRMVGDIAIDGSFDDTSGTASLSLNAPYLQQGKDKLISNSFLSLDVNTLINRCDLGLSTVLPGKNGDITVMLNADAANDIVDTEVSWIFDRKRSFKGNVLLSAMLSRDVETGKVGMDLNVKPSSFEINDTVWHVDPAVISYRDNVAVVKDVKVWRDRQYVSIEGKASTLPSDSLVIDLKDMDLDYVFETLNINHVKFGGRATGKLYASNLMSGSPKAFTDNLFVERLTYNKGLLGDAILKSRWLNDEKKVVIQADIREGKLGHTTIDGGLWVGKDSLSFECNADHLNILFLKPFLAAFTTDVQGRASGYAKLYGTFKDIDLIGKIHADTLRMRVDYTNTYYTGSDSIHISPGRIDIRDFTLYDCEGNTAKLNGWVTHRYFHEPCFDFRVSEARNFLSYDTNEKINPIWYGRVYGNGGCRIDGEPGVVNIRVDMSTAPRSKFTFVLSDAELVEDYKFLTFTDKKKEAKQQLVAQEMEKDVPDPVKRFRKKIQTQNESRPSKFNMQLFVSATPQAEMIIVMDPVAGDRIRAYGKGDINLAYASDKDLFMSGTYELEKGFYNFTLQDIIIKDFEIRNGSTIAFSGNPYEAVLDIAAIYKVNTNLSDLDKSFSSDRDLNSTNVPVEAVLNVSGEMSAPNIDFDINLPTVTQDVTRKVKSIISTDDMMNRQIIYLLALNRFYTPEYMGAQGNNNELASVASSTISSQLSNMLGQLSDNWSFSPYFRTDKGDFSDMEVDLALSSTLLNNRLLLNGNFGYRDRTTSSTTFVGDFDIEYLLNRRGTLRLKAYNHYNDQNYYLKSALTTQGIGIVYKHDFDRWFSFLRKKRKTHIPAVESDSLSVERIQPQSPSNEER